MYRHQVIRRALRCAVECIRLVLLAAKVAVAKLRAPS